VLVFFIQYTVTYSYLKRLERLDSLNYVMVLEYANEGDLRRYLENKFSYIECIEWKVKIQMALDITCGLKYLHSKKIIHQDLVMILSYL